MKNTSGMTPINLNVLVLPDKVEDRRGAVWLPETAKDREQWAQTKGTIVALCGHAFAEMGPTDEHPERADLRPRPGARVTFARHNGSVFDGMDGEKYRLLKDVDITGLLA